MSRDIDKGSAKYRAKFSKMVGGYLEGFDFADKLSRLDERIVTAFFKDLENDKSGLASVVDCVYSGDKGDWARHYFQNWVDSSVFGFRKEDSWDSEVLVYIYGYMESLSNHRRDVLDRTEQFKNALKPNLESFKLGFVPYSCWSDKITKRFIGVHKKHFSGYKAGLESDVREYAMLKGDVEEFSRRKLEGKIQGVADLCDKFGEKFSDGFGGIMLGLFDENIERRDLLKEQVRLKDGIENSISSGCEDSFFFQPEYGRLIEVYGKLGQGTEKLKKGLRGSYVGVQKANAIEGSRVHIEQEARYLAGFRARDVVEALNSERLIEIDNRKVNKIKVLPDEAKKLFK